MNKTLPTLASVHLCSGCNACRAACLKGANAIRMVAASDGFLYPHVDADRCIGCHACERACPVLSEGGCEDSLVRAYAAWCREDGIRLDSTSGGVFTELARCVIEKGGVVFGCVWERPGMKAIHHRAETVEDLAEMRGAKYVQSDVRDTFLEVQSELGKCRWVLYSGTPCQIAGLRRFLKRDFETLVCVEIVCHSVPAPGVFERLKADLAKKFHSPIRDIAFRDKRVSWRKGMFVVCFANDQQTTQFVYTLPYMGAFGVGVSVRESCFACRSKGGRSGADVTIGDFWGIERLDSTLDDSKGISLLLIHTPQGNRIVEKIAARLERREFPYEEAVGGNPYYRTSISRPRGRAWFFAHYRRAFSLDYAIWRARHYPLVSCLGRAILQRIGKLVRR